MRCHRGRLPPLGKREHTDNRTGRESGSERRRSGLALPFPEAADRDPAAHSRRRATVDGDAQAIARAIFDSLDADSNGVLEGNELAGVPSTELLAVAAKGAGKKTVESRNRPNKPRKQRITADELTAHLLSSIGTPFAIVVETGAKSAGKSAAERLVAGRYGSSQSDSLEMSSLLAILDANGDGRVTLDECTRVDELFHLLDLNDDETISRTEMAEVAAAKNSSRKRDRPP